MALFKIERGLSENLPLKRKNTSDGTIYFTTDDGKIYIDITNEEEAKIGENRICLNADKADRDSLGRDIKDSYSLKNDTIKSMTVNGKIITYIKNDGTSGTIETQDTDTTYDEVTDSSAGLMRSDDKIKLDSINKGAEVNQNTFSNININNTVLYADNKTDTLTFEAEEGLELIPDVENDKVKFSVKAISTDFIDILCASS